MNTIASWKGMLNSSCKRWTFMVTWRLMIIVKNTIGYIVRNRAVKRNGSENELFNEKRKVSIAFLGVEDEHKLLS